MYNNQRLLCEVFFICTSMDRLRSIYFDFYKLFESCNDMHIVGTTYDDGYACVKYLVESKVGTIFYVMQTFDCDGCCELIFHHEYE